MSMYRHREPKVRRAIPEQYRRRSEGAHVVRTTYEPRVCPDCYGMPGVIDPEGFLVECVRCGGTGEI